jgi:hypothetical protein
MLHLRLDALARTHLIREIESCSKAGVSSGISSGVGPSADVEGQKRISPQNMSGVHHAAAFVWRRDENGVPLPSYINHSNKHWEPTTTSIIQKCKPGWVDVHILSIIKHLTNGATTSSIVPVQDSLQPGMLYGNHRHTGRGGCMVFILPLLVHSFPRGLLPQREPRLMQG